MDFLDIEPDHFTACAMNLGHPIFGKVGGEWKLRRNVNKTGTDD